MKIFTLSILLCLFCSSIVSAQDRYDQLMSEGKAAYDQLDFSKAISKFKAAKIGSGENQIKEADRQIELANKAYIKAIQDANKKTELALEEAKQEAKISEANRLAFMANQYVEKENYEEAFQIATVAMSMVKNKPTNLVEQAYGNAGYRHFSKALEQTNAVVLDIQNNSNKAFVAQLRNQAPLLFDQSGTLINRLTGHEKRIIDLVVSSKNNRMATSSEDGLINFWDEDGKLIQTYKTELPGVFANQLVATSTGEIIAIFNDHRLNVFSKDGVEKYNIQEVNKITSAIPSADGKLLLTCTAKGLIKLWDASTMILIKELANTGNYIHQAVFSLDDSKIIIASEDQGILVFDRRGASLPIFAAMRNQTGFFEIACAPDQSTIALAAKNGRVEVWNLEGEFLSSFQRSVDQRQLLSFSADSKKLLSIDKKNSLVLWDLKKGAAVYFDQHKDQITSLSFSPDGQYILSGSKDHTAKLWKLDGSLIMNLDRHTAGVRMALFSEDGRHIITGGADQQIFLSPAFNHVLAELNEEIETELTIVQKQKWGLD